MRYERIFAAPEAADGVDSPHRALIDCSAIFALAAGGLGFATIIVPGVIAGLRHLLT